MTLRERRGYEEEEARVAVRAESLRRMYGARDMKSRFHLHLPSICESSQQRYRHADSECSSDDDLARPCGEAVDKVGRNHVKSCSCPEIRGDQ